MRRITRRPDSGLRHAAREHRVRESQLLAHQRRTYLRQKVYESERTSFDAIFTRPARFALCCRLCRIQLMKERTFVFVVVVK